ncbi:MAG: oligosaccharide flippase family protein [Candidatus Symbiothrix sp.]|jgi:O-antigen/teichoic acid export membrane protein|nr:oligosaccharide flippase family protein [Candidatus Symbiothrix sp.]
MALLKDSVIYGGTNIVVKLGNWLLTPLLTYTLATSEYGMMTHLYAYVALFVVFLTFGMETGLFRFINQTDKYHPDTVYSTTLTIVGGIIAVFLAVFLTCLPIIRPWLWNDQVPDAYIRLVLVILAFDSFSAIPFAYLRYKKRPIKFGALKMLYTVLYAVFCVIFLVVCPYLNKHHSSLVAWFWHDGNRLYYVFIANLLATGIQTICLLWSELSGFRYRFDGQLTKKMLAYCFPLMLMGLAGMSNQVVDKLVFPAVYPDAATWSSELGIYSGCFKIALIMMMFTQAFRYAYEPFVFEQSRSKDAKQTYSDVMKYFVIFGLFVFLGVVFYLDLIKYMIKPTYFVGLGVVPIVLIGELFFAIYFNLSVWYKLTDKTYWGTIFSVAGFVIIIGFNILFIPQYSYYACAWAAFAGNLVIMLLSYIVGQKVYPIKYDLKTLGLYTALAGALYAISCLTNIQNIALRLAWHTVLIVVYVVVVVKRDMPLRTIPFVRRWLH